MSSDSEPDIDTERAIDPPGQRLRQTRETLGLSRKDVANQLRLSHETISALEEDRYDALPAPIFVRGYLRNYAAVLNLPGDELVDGYGKYVGVEPPQRLVSTDRRRQVGSGDRRMRYATAAIVLVLVGLVAIWWYNNELFGQLGGAPAAAPSHTPVAALPPAPPPVADAPPAAQAPGAAVAASVAPAAATTSPDQVAKAPASAVSETPRPAAAASVTAAATATTAGRARAAKTAGSADVLTLRLNASSWLEVRDATGKRLVYKLGRSGDVEQVSGKAPFQVVLGNSPAVEVQINGEPFDQSPYNGNGRKARFKVGG